MPQHCSHWLQLAEQLWDTRKSASVAALRNNLAVNQPVRLVLGDAEKTEQGVFSIATPSAELVLVALEAYNSDGILLDNERLSIESSSMLIV